MGLEEQIEERQVLDSIFPEEITDISETEYRIAILLDLTPDDADPNEPPTLILRVSYAPTYPDTPPHLDISPPTNAPPHPHFSVSADKETLLASLSQAAEENLGMAMIFTLVTHLKEQAEELIIERRAAAAREKEEQQLAAEREENKKFHGTPVTRESFLAWREGFMKEMEEERARREEERLAELKKSRGAGREDKKLTGKQLWERGLVGKIDEEGDEGDLVEGVDGLKVAR